jgi:acyl-homoserine-lactone acylase
LKPNHLAVLLLAASVAAAFPHTALAAKSRPASEEQRWRQASANVTIVRDKWGIPHVFGKSDADAVFGMLYAQAEDDFNRVERNYINALGRACRSRGRKGAVPRPADEALHRSGRHSRRSTPASPAWLRAADGRVGRRPELVPAHAPGVKPQADRALRAVDGAQLLEGSIGGDIESVDAAPLEAFYGMPQAARRS